jgi:Zn finger protein HypA/HybF involved in hydrogenase expression
MKKEIKKKKEKQVKTKFVCPRCKSKNIEVKAWVKPNENNKFIIYSESEDNCYCEDCGNFFTINI